MRLTLPSRRILIPITAAAMATALTGGVALASPRTSANHIDYGHGKVPCSVASNGLPYPPGSGTMAYQTTCTLIWRVSIPAAYGTRMVLRDPAGHFTVWKLKFNYSH